MSQREPPTTHTTPAPELEQPAVLLDQVSFSYPLGHSIFTSVSLQLPALDFACIVGPNGGGKTTLVKLILGLLHPTAGRLTVLGVQPVKARPRIGYLPQHAVTDPNFPIKVLDVVLMGLLSPRRSIGRFSRAEKTTALEVLDSVGIGHLASNPFATLSGGQRQRTLLARAVVARPDLLLLDEPEAGLDQRVEQEFFELLLQLNQHTTILLVSHDLGFVSSYVKTVVCIGERVEVHPTSSISGRTINEIYGGEVNMIRHDHSLLGELHDA